tara:strand:+ start:159 stop:275 length:117 start_codon:yes stop_codon:yes gene_type:complete
MFFEKDNIIKDDIFSGIYVFELIESGETGGFKRNLKHP